MVLPIIVGIGATVSALVLKATLLAFRKYRLLPILLIASLNGIILSSGARTPLNSLHRAIRERYPNTGFRDPMTEQEALLVLGIEGPDIDKLDAKMVRDRYRRLMVLNHPDKRGSAYLSQRINEAREILDKSYLYRK